MKKLLLGFALGAISTLGVLWAWQYWRYSRVSDEVALFDIARTVVEGLLAGTHVLDVSVSPRSNALVNYVHDRLYDVHVTYERRGQIRRITAPFGKYRGQWINPNNTDLAILDDRAEVIYRKSAEQQK